MKNNYPRIDMSNIKKSIPGSPKMPLLFSEDAREKRSVYRNTRDILNFLSREIGERTIRKYDDLERARCYIIDYFKRYGGNPLEEKYIADDHEVSNIIVEIEGTDRPDDIILVGAHYDTIEDTPGADDNATGIAALLELYRLLLSLIFAKYRLAFTLIPRGFSEHGQDIPRYLYFQLIWVNSGQINQYH